MNYARHLTKEVLGFSTEGRPIELWATYGAPEEARILVVAGQHGDEPLAIEAVEAVVQQGGLAGVGSISLIPCLNPDGRARGQRLTCLGYDLNRDHQLLLSPEVRALHRYCRKHKPQLIIDMHTFKARRKVLLKQRYEIGDEVMLDISNHPAFQVNISKAWKNLVEPTLNVLSSGGIRVSQYMLFRDSGRVRTSSADLLDVRNGLAAKLNAIGVLIEGREPTRRQGSKERARGCLISTLLEICNTWQKNYNLLQENLLGRDGQVFVDTTRVRTADSLWRRMVCLRSGLVETREVSSRVYADLRPRCPITLPDGYLVPKHMRALLGTLSRHRFKGISAEGNLGGCLIEEASVRSVIRSKNSNRAPRRVVVDWRVSTPPLCEYLYFPLDSLSEGILPAYLEPAGRYGLHRYSSYGIHLSDRYPILRVVGSRTIAARTEYRGRRIPLEDHSDVSISTE